MSSNQVAKNNVDLTEKLPDEVLCKIISSIPSLPHRFQLAAVNTKFRRCVVTELRKPIPLKMHFYYERLNDHKVPVRKWPQAIEVLAPKTHFTRVTIIDFDLPFDDIPILSQVLSILADSECLDEMRSFHSNLTACKRQYGSALENMLTKCPKLSVLRLDFPLRPLASAPYFSVCQLNLGSILTGKPLTRLELYLFEYGQEDLVNLFESLKPKMLKTLDLTFTNMKSMNLVELVNNCIDAWSDLREIRLDYEDRSTPMQLEGLFGTVLAQLPLLQSCTIEHQRRPSDQEFVTGLMALFHSSNRTQPIVVHVDFDARSGCQVVDLVEQLKRVYPAIQVYFDIKRGYNMRLELGNVTYVSPVSPRQCGHNCLQCRRLYPVVVHELVQARQRRVSFHMAHYRLDRCKVNRVVTESNEMQSQLFPLPDCVALSADTSENGDFAVITFEDEEGGDQFYITLDCIHCLSDSCVGCLEI